MIIMGTRPEVIKIAPVIMELQKQADKYLTIVVSTGQHNEMYSQATEVFGDIITAHYSLNLMTSNQQLAPLSAKILDAVDQILLEINPHLVLVQGDTTTAYISALAAFYRSIPVGHIEAGLRTFDLHAPFPEELNRQGISQLATYHFAATPLSASNLVVGGRPLRHVYVTGNTVVDAVLMFTAAAPSDTIVAATKLVRRLVPHHPIVCLLTAHRRENHGEALQQILGAVQVLLAEQPNLVVFFPVHLNPNVRKAVERAAPGVPFFDATRPIAQALGSRLVLMDPLNYKDLIHMMNMSHFVLTDSGGIQEEATALGRPVVVLRESTERKEGVEAGVAVLAGSDAEIITQQCRRLMTDPTWHSRMSRQLQLYGDGHAAGKIVNIITEQAAVLASRKIEWHQHDLSDEYVIVLTVWKRQTLEMQLQMLQAQSVLKRHGTVMHVIIFHNGNHIDVRQTWSAGQTAGMRIQYVHSLAHTGYYGRFVAPLLSITRAQDPYWFVFDDDVIFGDRYLENCKRVVDGGALCTRNGRFVSRSGDGWEENLGCSPRGWQEGMQVTWDNDVVYDFGGHIWAGRMSWLRTAWNNPPPTLENLEDYWISAVLQAQHGIPTKRPRCPAPSARDADLQLCACSMKTALYHEDVELGQHVHHTPRGELLNMMQQHYQPSSISTTDADFIQHEAEKYVFQSAPVWKVEGTVFSECLYWM